MDKVVHLVSDAAVDSHDAAIDLIEKVAGDLNTGELKTSGILVIGIGGDGQVFSGSTGLNNGELLVLSKIIERMVVDSMMGEETLQ